MNYKLYVTINYPKHEVDEQDNKERNIKEVLEAIAFELRKHDTATSFVFIVAKV